LPREKPVEELRARAARFRGLASAATDDEAAQALLELAGETELLIRAIEENAGSDNKP